VVLATISRRSGTLRGRTAIVDDDAFAQAKRQAREFDKVLDGSGPRRALIARAAVEVNLTSRQVYNLLKRYAAERTVSSLLPRRGNSRAKRLNESVEAIIAATLSEQWLVEEAPPLAPVVEEIRARCSTAGQRPPSYIAVQTRIPLLFDAMTIAKARSANPKHVRRLKPRPGYITAPRPLAVCQIDHTPADIHFVEVVNDAGVFVGRPYLTIVVDVFSRAILGFCLTIEKPSSLSVALCLAQALCPKGAWLRARGLGDHDWPMFGRPETLVVDGVPERDRLGKIEVRYDPRDVSHIYLRHPRTKAFQVVGRRDGRTAPVTLWEHERERALRRGALGQTPEARVALRREIRRIAGQAEKPREGAHRRAPTKAELRDAVRAIHAQDAAKPYQAMTPAPTPAAEAVPRVRRPLSVEEW
jgi:transposase InsO family protein